MHLEIPLSHLGLLVPQLDLAAPTAELVNRLREHFAFLGDITVTLVADHAHIEARPPAAAKHDEAARLADRAAARAREGDFSRAAELYQRVLTLAPAHPGAHRELAMCHMELGQLEAAKDALIDALKLAPADAWSFVILGNVYTRLEQTAQALRFYQRALDLQPADPWALHGLAVAEMRLGHTAAGLARFTQATAQHPEFPNAWHGRALAELRTGDPAAAETTLRQLFARASANDPRSRPVFTEARRLFLEIQTTLATAAESDAFKTTQDLRTHVEQLSGYPVEFTPGEKLPPGIAALARPAWRHDGRRHRVALSLDTTPPNHLRIICNVTS